MHRHSCYRGADRGDDYRDHFLGSRHGRGFGAFPGFMGGFGPGGRAFWAGGRKLASGDLQLVLLTLLAERPSHGYELIKALEERSGGFYSPSPGMVYPALTWLEEVGYASVTAEGAKKLYNITDAGRAYLKDNQDAAQAMLSQLQFIARKMGRMREFFGGYEEEDSQELDAARHELKQALREKRGASADERGRIVAILRSAAVQIRGI